MPELDREPARWASVLPLLAEFQSSLSPSVPQLKIIPANDRQWTLDRYEKENKKGTFKQYGVYLLYDPEGVLRYVGVAMNSFHDRIWSHEADVNRRWTDLIPFPIEYYYLAPALEFFLIARLKPTMNTTYRSYSVPEKQIDSDSPGPDR